jgi:hypothetical protein
MLIAIWNMLINGVFYGEPGSDFYTRRKPRTGPSSAPSTNQLKQLGYDVTLTPVQTAVAG